MLPIVHSTLSRKHILKKIEDFIDFQIAILFVGLTDHMKPPSFTPRTKKGKKVDAWRAQAVIDDGRSSIARR